MVELSPGYTAEPRSGTQSVVNTIVVLGLAGLMAGLKNSATLLYKLNRSALTDTGRVLIDTFDTGPARR